MQRIDRVPNAIVFLTWRRWSSRLQTKREPPLQRKGHNMLIRNFVPVEKMDQKPKDSPDIL